MTMSESAIVNNPNLSSLGFCFDDLPAQYASKPVLSSPIRFPIADLKSQMVGQLCCDLVRDQRDRILHSNSGEQTRAHRIHDSAGLVKAVPGFFSKDFASNITQRSRLPYAFGFSSWLDSTLQPNLRLP
ncbi:hypothetical protein VNO77_26031 [Canavalia gladiata]|uniref:Uncharacterized protein n=1 Tax=Canavalia gladiata TaxID=3824 RepID=A0AAN9KUI0_CANGL